MDKSFIVNILEENKEALEKNFSILKVGLFGSYSTNSFTEKSDIDIIYELKKGKRLGLKEVYELELFFKNLFKVDKIDLVNNEYVNPIIESEIRKTVIYV